MFLDNPAAIPYNSVACRKGTGAKSKTAKLLRIFENEFVKEEPNRLDKVKAVSYNQFCAWELDLAVPANKGSE